MDRISCLAFILYQSNNVIVKNVAVKLVVGDVSMKELKKDKMLCSYIKEAEKTLKKSKLNKNELCRFVEEYVCT